MSAPLLATLITVVAALGERTVGVGDEPRYTFHVAPRNSVLVRTLEDLRGRPALFEFWGPRCPTCVQNAVPAALDLQETWGEDLQVVLVEVQGAGADEAARFALRQRWFGGRSLWTSETPFWPGGNSLPAFVLLGNQGQVLLKGNPLTQSREIERLVAEQVRLRRAPPATAPESLRPAWGEYKRGNVARAVRLAADVESRLRGDAAALGLLAPALQSLRGAIDRRFADVRALAAAGFLDEADARLDGLRAGARDDDVLRARVDEIAAELASPAARAEREAGRELARLLSRYFESGGGAAQTHDLERFVERRAGTQAAARAADWARLATPASR